MDRAEPEWERLEATADDAVARFRGLARQNDGVLSAIIRDALAAEGVRAIREAGFNESPSLPPLMTPEERCTACLALNQEDRLNDSMYLPVDLCERIVAAIREAVEVERLGIADLVERKGPLLALIAPGQPVGRIGAVIQRAVEAERERCALLAESAPMIDRVWESCDVPDAIRSGIAAAIRGRGR